MTPDQWFAAHKGTAILVPKGGAGNDGQCFQAMDSFLHEVYGKPYIYTLGAIDVWYKALLDPLGFTRVAPGGPVYPGDFLLYDGIAPRPDGGYYGHVSIVSRPGVYGDFWSYDSNWGGVYNSQGQPVLHEVHHNDKYNSYITGYYRLAGGRGAGDITAAMAEGDDMVHDTDAEYWRYQKLGIALRGRMLSRDEFRASAVGRTWLAALETLSDSPEADTVQHAQEVGQAAIKDGWQDQIRNLSAALDDARNLAATLQDSATKQKIIERCTIDVANAPADKVSLLQKIAALFR